MEPQSLPVAPPPARGRGPTFKLSPGLSFILRNIPTILGPSVFVYIASQLASRFQIPHTSFFTSRFPRTILYALAFPIYLFIRVTGRDFKDWYNAKRLGAALPPKVKDWTPGSMKSMRVGLKNMRSGYPGKCISFHPVLIVDMEYWIGDFLRDWAEIYGTTYNYRIMFANRVSFLPND